MPCIFIKMIKRRDSDSTPNIKRKILCSCRTLIYYKMTVFIT